MPWQVPPDIVPRRVLRPGTQGREHLPPTQMQSLLLESQRQRYVSYRAYGRAARREPQAAATGPGSDPAQWACSPDAAGRPGASPDFKPLHAALFLGVCYLRLRPRADDPKKRAVALKVERLVTGIWDAAGPGKYRARVPPRRFTDKPGNARARLSSLCCSPACSASTHATRLPTNPELRRAIAWGSRTTPIVFQADAPGPQIGIDKLILVE